MKQVVILGGGFAGVSATLALVRSSLPDTKITIVDRNPCHLFTPSLYEVATNEEPEQNICIPLSELFGNRVTIITDTVEKIDIETQSISLQKNTSMHFDYLILALGSESAFMGIEGLEKYALSLKTIEDALAIKDKIKSMCCQEGACNKKVQVVIGGGGFSGTELAAEMLMYKNRLAKQNHLASDCLEVSIIQGSDRLLKELDSHVSDMAQKRIAGPQMKFCFGGHITEVTEKEIKTDDGKVYPYDIFIWTGGVQANHLGSTTNLPVINHGQVSVNEFLQTTNPSVFAVGDIAGFIDPKTQKPVPNVAQVAEEQGKAAGENVALLIKGRSPRQYTYRHFGYIVPLRGRFAAAELGNVHIDGFLGWVLQQLVFFRYLLGIFPWWKAMKRWNKFEIHLEQ